MKNIENKNGFLLTIGTILLIIPLIFLISYYLGVSETPSQDSMGKMRCDELHYFVEDVRRDMERSVVIFGRRSAVYAIDRVVETGVPFKDYAFICTEQCSVDCSTFVFDNTGSEAAIAELTLCGTLNGENVTYMTNHTIPEWIRKMESYSHDMHFVLDLNVSQLKVVPMDAWHFALMVDYKIRAYDEEGMCYYTENIIRALSASEIIGLEDPSYILQTNGHVLKYIINCTPTIKTHLTAGCSTEDWGNGTGTGSVVFYSDIESKTTYCNDNADVVSNQILVIDPAFGSCNRLGDDCFNLSRPNHFGGVVDYAKNNPMSLVNKCDVSIPWIGATCKMDNETTHGPGPGCVRPPGCNDTLIGTGDCVEIFNQETALGCKAHKVLVGYNSNETNTTCYLVSDIEENYNSECGAGEEQYNGPSFFDRLDGSLNLSDVYVNQSQEYFNTTLIGIETLVNLYDMKKYARMYPSVPVHTDATWVDYLYWADAYGCPVAGTCETMGGRLKLDCPHSYKYDVDTNCSSVSRCPCPDGRCAQKENCTGDAVFCPDAVCYQPTCSSGCGLVKVVNATDPGQCDSGSYCNAIGTCVPCFASNADCTFNDECCSGTCKGNGKCS
jgi:hypothetical protein